MTIGVVFVLAAVFVGAIAQRIAGLGFALLVAPLLVLLLGAHEGVVMVNVCGLVSSALIMTRVWSQVEWRKLLWLALPAAVATVPASVAAVRLPPAPLAVVVGLVVLIALTVSVFLERTAVVVSGRTPMGLAGALSGATNALAGVGGPAVSAYAVLSRWPQRPFAATLQPYFVLLSIMTLTVKLTLDPGQSPSFGPLLWALTAGFIVAGIAVGERFGRHVRDDHARTAVVVIAFLGALVALVKGVVDLLA